MIAADQVSSDGHWRSDPAARHWRQWLPHADQRRYGDRGAGRRWGAEDAAAPKHAREGWSCRAYELRHDGDARRWRNLPGLRARRRLDGFIVRRVRQLVELQGDQRHRRYLVTDVGTLCMNRYRLLPVPGMRAGGGSYADADCAEPGGHGAGLTAVVALHDVERTAAPKGRSVPPDAGVDRRDYVVRRRDRRHR